MILHYYKPRFLRDIFLFSCYFVRLLCSDYIYSFREIILWVDTYNMTRGDTFELRVVLLKNCHVTNLKIKNIQRWEIKVTAMAGVSVDETMGKWCEFG